MSRLAGKRIIITGSSRSLGREFALAVAREGASVVINGTDEKALQATRREIEQLGAPVIQVAGSVAETSVCKQLTQSCIEEFGGIDVFVNNAGIVRDRTLLKMSDEDFDEVIAVDLRGPFIGMREAALVMRDQGTGGHIINITSASGLVGNFGQTNYAAAKAGMMGMMYTAVKELSKYNIRCNSMWPIARTDMTASLIEKSGKTAAELGFGEPEEVAMALVWLASDAAAHWNGQCLTMNGRKTALWQSQAERQIHEQASPFTIEELEAALADCEPLTVYDPHTGG
ncbi:MAG: SDR family NAD(P)-dependent oxidoreductase [Halieaceae bacterium]